MINLKLVINKLNVFGLLLISFVVFTYFVVFSSTDNEIDVELRLLIDKHQLSGDPIKGIRIPNPESDLVKLGRDLFFSKDFGGQGDVACASCHHPFLGGGDDLSLSVGVHAKQPDLLGKGRIHNWKGKGAVDPKSDGRPNVPRNSPTIFNAGLYTKHLFNDGRISSIFKDGAVIGIKTPDSFFGSTDTNAGDDLLTAQSRFPIVSINEMRGYEVSSYISNDEIRKSLEQDLLKKDKEVTNGYWLKRFRNVFNDESLTSRDAFTFKYFSQAIAEYEKSLSFVNNRWFKYIRGDMTSLSLAEKQGAILFYKNVKEGGADCVSCHSGDFFTDEQFHNLAMPQIGRGVNKRGNDYGRVRVSRNAKDKYAFRTPSLLNVEVTGPYSHSGSYSSLEGVVKHHINIANSVQNYDYSLSGLSQFDNDKAQAALAKNNTLAALNKLLKDRGEKRKSVVNSSISESEQANVIAFLNTLTDPCVVDKYCLKKWIPDYENLPENINLLSPVFKEIKLVSNSSVNHYGLLDFK